MYGLDNRTIFERDTTLKIWILRVQKNLNIEKIAFKVVQMKLLAIHITNKKWSFDIFTLRNWQNLNGTWSLLKIIFGIKEKWIMDPYSVVLAIAINIPQRLKTGCVLQGHIYNQPNIANSF